MIQTGDPSGSGKGGQSIWGNPFADEIRSTLKVRSLYYILLQLRLDNSSTIVVWLQWQILGPIRTNRSFS